MTYAAGCWHTRTSLHIVRSALLRTQRPALRLLTKAYRTNNMVALPVLVGVLPAEYEMILARRVDSAHDNLTRAETDERGHVPRSGACPLYDYIRAEMLHGLEVLQTGPIYYAHLGVSWANFCRFREFARRTKVTYEEGRGLLGDDATGGRLAELLATGTRDGCLIRHQRHSTSCGREDADRDRTQVRYRVLDRGEEDTAFEKRRYCPYKCR
ncbi:hypothetical protein EVAR_100265_1 [Eumeta japonica]|uniref:Uncharacterized protein n=1 Tax=Eumeta variegata TaxID=151549 RepID=A0A4C1ZYF8_EUMVA|nr:hypothetical protein EVAR_100265_1 [Eumeta japonica]